MQSGKPTCLWNSKPPCYSKETASFLKTLIDESRITNQVRSQINSRLTKGESLPIQFKFGTKAAPSNGQKRTVEKTAFVRGVRRREAIIASGAYNTPKYRGIRDAKSREDEKDRLVSIFAYGEDLMNKRKVPQESEERPEKEPQIDRFDELWNELEERRQFLDEMHACGRSAEYEAHIATDISQIIREMEQIDRRRNQEMDAANM